jgi:hypothetical protein
MLAFTDQSAWLIKIRDRTVTTLAEAHDAFQQLSSNGITSVPILFSHPEIRQDISHNGLPIVSSAPFTQHIHDHFLVVVDYLHKVPPYEIVESGNVLNYVTRVMHLTCGKLTQQDDWSDWQHLEYLQLDQYNKQGMFGVLFP